MLATTVETGAAGYWASSTKQPSAAGAKSTAEADYSLFFY
jgi:hypothetical protein